ncbi:hypothetical protein MACK_003394 [Theileria orientalis]|uniref:Uncharacterized protein n=1 Tax=Theileria orientalis TaxID=68886 RepID=A0A976SIN5_THEOR|nr:hypothetical protein MACK_003394 [Theileria orientalis]
MECPVKRISTTDKKVEVEKKENEGKEGRTTTIQSDTNDARSGLKITEGNYLYKRSIFKSYVRNINTWKNSRINIIEYESSLEANHQSYSGKENETKMNENNL